MRWSAAALASPIVLRNDFLRSVAAAAAGRTDDVSPANLPELFELREALETQAARLAARRRNTQTFEDLREGFLAAPASLVDGSSGYYDLVARLDAAIDVAIANPFLLASLAGLRNHLARVRRLAQDNPARLAESVSEHLLIVQAILDRDGINTILSKLSGRKMYAQVIVALFTGMRLGEILATRWRCVDLGRKTILVREALEDGAQFVHGDAKMVIL